MPDSVEVAFTVKELLADINRKIDVFMSLLSTKADQVAFNHIQERLDKQEDRVRGLEMVRQHETWNMEWKKWLIPTLASIGGVVAVVLSIIHP